MQNFCRTPLWNWTVTWHTDDPDFTPCFEQTILLWIPCGYLWLSSVLEVYYYASHSRVKTIPWTKLNAGKIVLTAIIILLQIICLCYKTVLKKEDPDNVYPVDLYSPLIKIVTFILSLILLLIHKYNGMRSSGVQFIFWLLFSTCEVLSFRTLIKTSTKTEIEELFSDMKLVLYYPLVFVQFVLNCWADATPRSCFGGRQHLRPQNDHRPCPEIEASFLSKLTFSWVSELAWKGYKIPLQFSDVWKIRRQDKSERLISIFRKHQNKTTSTAHTTYHKTGAFHMILKPLWMAMGTTYVFGCILKQTADILAFVSPQILSFLISYVEKPDEESWKGYFYAVAMLVNAVLQTIFLNQSCYIVWVMAMRAQSTLQCSVFRKALLISNAARKESTIGEIVNLMSVDATKVQNLVISLDQMWGAPIQIALALYFLYAQLGPAAFAGFTVLILLISLNIIVTSKMEKYQTNQMKTKDERVKMMNEILSGIKILKLYAWEPSFEEKIQNIREREIKILTKQAYWMSIVEFMWHCAPVLVAVISFATYILMDDKNILDAQKAFVSLSLFNLLNRPMTMLPVLISHTMEARVSLKRLTEFLNAEENDTNAITHDIYLEDPIIIENGKFGWDEKSVTLTNINLKIKEGQLVAIVGTVGCGKSSLLAAILGEMKKFSGRINTRGSIAYVSQQAWIQNATLCDNVLFGLPMETRKYEKVVDSCDLKPDLEILPGGDKTEIGEKGINLSGGQKQRVALARAVYSNADIYLLDDPLSAVDSHVGKHIFDHALGPNGILRRKTRILVTHGITFLPQVDQIIVLKNGQISECGTYNELLKKRGAFADFLIHYIGESGTDSEEISIIRDLESAIGPSKFFRQRSRISESEYRQDQDSVGDSTNRSRKTTCDSLSSTLSGKERLVEEEIAYTGNVKLSVYMGYMKAIGSRSMLSTIILYLIYQAFSIGSNMWLSAWSSEPVINGTHQAVNKREKYLCVYGALGFLQSLAILGAAVVLSRGALQAAKTLHNDMLSRILKAPMWFFDKTPTGRILNRFSEDVQQMDYSLPWSLFELLACTFKVFASLVVISYSTPLFMIIIIPATVLYFFLQRYFVATSRQLSRMEPIMRSPIYSHFGETLTGITTIKAFAVQDRFISECEARIDNFQMTRFPFLVLERWLGVRLESIGNFIVFCAALLGVYGRKTLSSSLIGLSVAYALQITQTLNWMTIIYSYIENEIVSIERIREYGEVAQEAEWKIKERRPPKKWPKNGAITFHEYQTRYRAGIGFVLKDVTCKIQPGEKIGIVGRTGAGKSSLALGIFRIIEAAGGCIIIDGHNISHFGLHDIRRRLTIIPQDPVLFSGTLRFNLDPFSRYKDENLWKALELAHLKTFVQTLSSKLEHEIAEGGEKLRAVKNHISKSYECVINEIDTAFAISAQDFQDASPYLK